MVYFFEEVALTVHHYGHSANKEVALTAHHYGHSANKEVAMEHQTGLENYYLIKNNKKLRYGYTTGSCAAAAAKAAVTMLLSGKRIEETALITPKGILLHLLIEDIRQEKEEVVCAVRKDGGDDPDVTDGVLVYAKVQKCIGDGIRIDGGCGVGRVTKPGLQQPVGNAAINKVPRQMILSEIEEICNEYGYEGGIAVEIFVPEGEEIARKTFNPRLGIVGGISVLGTSGIVVPMSERALIDSIRVEMKMLVENGGDYLIVTPGNYGELFSKEQLDVDLTYSMKCSNYVGETLEMAAELDVKGILFVSHIGKFIKVSGGIMNTHSHHADSRAELMASQAIRAGADLNIVRQILETVTTEDAVNILMENNLLEATMKEIIDRVQFYLTHRVQGNCEVGTILFSSVHGKLGQSENVSELICKINQGRK